MATSKEERAAALERSSPILSHLRGNAQRIVRKPLLLVNDIGAGGKHYGATQDQSRRLACQHKRPQTGLVADSLEELHFHRPASVMLLFHHSEMQSE